eukprot:TRINITY_DN96328_c0_g1_i1.p1 TRINITY_DN96328_c0_g1~~TRINITY_DN96328_c0_g1_i1.p1  ORF type:complete len:680 (-),score=147.39 TRINITY_DN96328_c0_g1_i1:161-2200(-)
MAMWLLVCLATLIAPSFGEAPNGFTPVPPKYSFLDSIQLSENEIGSLFTDELAASDAAGTRLGKLQDALRVTFDTLPKNKDGNLDHEAVRYVLHRFFVQKYGWFIKGLEPSDEASWHHSKSPAEALDLKDWVAPFLQDAIDQRTEHKGTDLHSLAALTAALEDLVQKEARGRLETAYKIHGASLDEKLDRQKADEIVRTWYISFLLAGNFSASDADQVSRKKAIFARKYSGWKEADEFLRTVEDKHYAQLGTQQSSQSAFDDVAKLISRVGEEYYQFNDKECKELKSTMYEMEGKKAGRVRLSVFYKKSLYSHWRFTEKADYLRKLGALDESDPQQPQVILPNYMMSRPNCLESSHLYAVCCRNECEELMDNLEGELKAGDAKPDDIIQLVEKLGSDTVKAPHVLAPGLKARLVQVASSNGGTVPIHGRLFAQWMHHAYPRECPYPHESGSTSPQTPDEWMKATGETSSATREEMEEQVASDVCMVDDSGKPGKGCSEDLPGASDLPWSDAEELLDSKHEEPKEFQMNIASAHSEDHEPAHSFQIHEPVTEDPEVVQKTPVASTNSKHKRWGMDVIACVIAVAMAGALAMDYWLSAVRNKQSKGEVLYINQVSNTELNRRLAGLKAALALWALGSIAWLMDLLDTAIFLCAMTGGLIMLAARRFSHKLLPKSKGEKSVV